MKDGQHNHSFGLLDEEDRIWKSPEKNSSNLAMNNLIVERVLAGSLNGMIELSQEPAAKAFELDFIPVARPAGLNLSSVPYEERTFHESASNLAFTSLHGDPSSGLSRYSS